MTRTKRAVAAGALIAATVAAGTGVALANARSNPDPAPEQKKEADYTRQQAQSATVSEQQARDSALARHAGTVIDAHLEDEGAGLRWEVKPDDGNTVWEVQIDANTGQVVSDKPDD